MTGRCVDNPRIGITGCGATYSGKLQHSVAKVSWSTHPDGRAHTTAVLSLIEMCWRGGEMRNPANLGYHQDPRGRWRYPVSPDSRGVTLQDSETDGEAP